MASNATDPDESLHLQVRRLSGEVERLREDAERYRWLRDNADMQFGALNRFVIMQPTMLTIAEIDASIDEAMRGSE